MEATLELLDQEAKQYEHVVIENIYHWDTENEELQSAHLEIYGHCIVITHFEAGMQHKTAFSPDQTMTCKLTPATKKNGLPQVNINNDPGFIFLMTEEQFDLIDQYYTPMIEKQAMKYTERGNVLLQKLFEHIDELSGLAVNFVEGQPRGQFTDLDNLMMITVFIFMINPHQYYGMLPMGPEAVSSFVSEKKDYAESRTEAVSSFVQEDLRYFVQLLQEKEEDVDFAVAYTFLLNIVLQYYANDWEETHSNAFGDVSTLDLPSAIERFCSLEDIDVSDADTQGRFFYYLFHHHKFDREVKIFDHVETFRSLIQKQLDQKKFINFKNRLKEQKAEIRYSIDDVDLMDGQEFERFLSQLFARIGYKTEVTKASGDQGIDIIAEKNGKRFGIQAKCYSRTVGNSAIQEAVSGKAFYNLNKVIVVTNNFFTDSALQLAQVNGVILWDRNLLKEKITEAFCS